MHQNLEFHFSVKTYGDSDVAILRNTLVYRIDVHARLLILRKNFPLHGLILVCTFNDFEKKIPLHVYSILCEQPYFGLHVY